MMHPTFAPDGGECHAVEALYWNIPAARLTTLPHPHMFEHRPRNVQPTFQRYRTQPCVTTLQNTAYIMIAYIRRYYCPSIRKTLLCWSHVGSKGPLKG